MKSRSWTINGSMVGAPYEPSERIHEKEHATSLIVETNRTWVKDVSNNARRQQTVLGKGGEHETKRKRVRHLFVRLW